VKGVNVAQWAEIEDFPDYEVSADGEVVSLLTSTVLSHRIHPRTGLHNVALYREGKLFIRSVHRLVAHAFLGEPPYDHCVPVFLDGNRNNLSYDNLEWRTRSEAIELTAEQAKTEPSDPRRVRCLETGVVYDNALEAARDIGGFEKYIILCAQRGTSMTYKRAHWEFLFD